MSDPSHAEVFRVVPGWRWLQGQHAQDLEWAALEEEFWSYIRMNTWEVGVIKKGKRVDEQRREVILYMEVDVLGKIVPGSLRIGVDG